MGKEQESVTPLNKYNMRIIFCDSGFSGKEVDYMYASEYKAAREALFRTSLFSFEAFKRNTIGTTLKRVSMLPEKTTTFYRGWMMTPAQYELFYNGLLEKNIQLINNPAEYKFCHYLPESYETIKAFTPLSTFKKLEGDFNINDFKKELSVFGNKPIIVKDYVKSQKHYWQEACFIPDASDLVSAETVIRKFIELQDVDLNEGLVFREYVELEELASHSKSGMPLTKEFRLFIENGKVISVFKYWDEGDYENIEPVIEPFKEVIGKIKSNFFTMDIAKRKNGEWIIVELGDGQVAGLPDNADRELFYNALKNN